MKRRDFALAATAGLPVWAWAQGPAPARPAPQEGIEYVTLDKRVPAESNDGKIEVIEFFWYSCPHCNAFEPRFAQWLKTTPKDVVVRRVPVRFRDDFEPQQRMFYTLEAMGKLAFRTSYGQNVLRHSVEVAFLCQMIADELGLDGNVARRAGFLHDIGKAMDHEMEGGHPAIGLEFLRKHGEKSEAVLNAVAGHHGDIPSTTPYTPIVMAADAISGARPGARRESMEMYVKRLQQLEGIARQHQFVDEAYAIQAGREVRVVVDAKKADDAYAFKIAQEIAKQVEQEMTFPGEIKVTVLRETRAEATAR
jgi:putative nucleotidyltransferase with HDIG domain